MAGIGAVCGLFSSRRAARVLSIKAVQGFRITQDYGQNKLKEEIEIMNELYLPSELTDHEKKLPL